MKDSVRQMENRVGVLVGTFPPEKCGVGDYSYNLMNADQSSGWKLFYYKNWGIKTLFSKIRDISNSNIECLNIQYPSMGYGYSLLPHIVCAYFSMFSKKTVAVTLHEYTRLGAKSRLATSVFLIFAKRIIFTNEFEREAAIRRFSFVRKKSKVVKIYSNITPSPTIRNILERKYDLGYFGLLTPKKGIEDFLAAAGKILRQNPDTHIYIMGQTLEEYSSFAKQTIEEAEKIGVELLLNKEQSFVSNTLSDTKLCYLPYPDGVSERRGSFLAAVLNGCLVCTNSGEYTTNAHKKICFFTDKTGAAEDIIEILSKSYEEFFELQSNIKQFVENELPQSWGVVVDGYNNFIFNNKTDPK